MYILFTWMRMWGGTFLQNSGSSSDHTQPVQWSRKVHQDIKVKFRFSRNEDEEDGSIVNERTGRTTCHGVLYLLISISTIKWAEVLCTEYFTYIIHYGHSFIMFTIEASWFWMYFILSSSSNDIHIVQYTMDPNLAH